VNDTPAPAPWTFITSDPCPYCGHVVSSIAQQANNEGKIDHVVYCRQRREAPVIN
jgi:hypothetical protein